MLFAVATLRRGCVDARVDVDPFIGEEIGVDVEANLCREAEEAGLAHRLGRCEGYDGRANVKRCPAGSVGDELNMATASMLKI